jgi:hypothetical protein
MPSLSVQGKCSFHPASCISYLNLKFTLKPELIFSAGLCKTIAFLLVEELLTSFLKKYFLGWSFKPIFLATWEAETGRIAVQGHPRQKVHKTISQPMAGNISVCLSFQLHREAQQEDHGSD